MAIFLTDADRKLLAEIEAGYTDVTRILNKIRAAFNLLPVEVRKHTPDNNAWTMQYIGDDEAKKAIGYRLVNVLDNIAKAEAKEVGDKLKEDGTNF